MKRSEKQWAAYERSAIHEYDILQEDFDAEVEARQRDRARLRAVLAIGKRYRNWCRVWREAPLFAIKIAWRSRFSSAWKAAAKKWRAKAVYYRDGQLEADNIHLFERHRVLVADRDRLAATLQERTEERDKLAAQPQYIFNEAAVTERDALAARLAAIDEDPLSVCEQCDVGGQMARQTHTIGDLNKEIRKLRARLAEVQRIIEEQRDKYESISPVIVMVSLDAIEAALRGGEERE
jgi:hypothetical protein